jgi:DNA segregation ATPase FtsK/SpoIIIE, S-DNA-T family
MSSITALILSSIGSRLSLLWNATPIVRLRGAFMCLLGLAFLAAFMTYRPGDPSLNTATSEPAHNILKGPGALIADLGVQSFGLASWAIGGFLIYFGVRRLLHTDVEATRAEFRRSGLYAAACVLFLSAILGPVRSGADPVDSFSLGGFWGLSINGLLAGVFAFMKLPAAPFFASVLFFGLGFYCFNKTFHLKSRHYVLFAGNVARVVQNLAHATGLSKTMGQAPVIADDTDDVKPAKRARKTGLTLEAADTAPLPPVAERLEATLAKGAAPVLKRDITENPIQISKPEVRQPAPEPQTPPWDDEDDSLNSALGIHAPAMRGPEATRQESFEFLRPKFKLPELNILAKPKVRSATFDEDTLRQNARMLESVLAEFGVRGVIDQIRPGPVVTLYELVPAAGVKHARVVALADDIARNMSARSARVAVVQGRNAIGIELPNATRETVYLRDLLASGEYEKTGHILPMALGETIGGEPYIADLAKMPHLLIAGTTGSGKSVGVNAMILSILYRLDPEQCKFIMIDPKMLELSVYDGIPHLLTPVVTDPKKAVVALKWTVKEMEDRYRRMSKIGVRNIASFNERAKATAAEGKNFVRKVQTGFDEVGQPIYELDEMVPEPMPYLVVVVDEVADLMMVAGKDIEGAVQRLAQMARAAGIHLIMATQRPSVDVITGTIKANFPTRISFQVTSKIDSRTILGEQGAEQLLGQGDMLYMAGGGRITRLHGPFVADGEVETVAQFLREQGTPQYLEDVTAGGDDEGSGDGSGMGEGGGSGDDLYDKAVYFVTFDRKASTSYIQRKLQIGYNRAASLMEKMEQEGIVGPANHVGKRDILVGPPPGH